MTKPLETLTYRESSDLNGPNNHTCALGDNLHNRLLPLPPPTSFVFSWSSCLGWWLRPFQGFIQFSWVSPKYTGVYMLLNSFVFLLLICLSLQGVLNQEPKKVERKLFSLFYKG